jgi:hypothetical protein
MIGTPSGKAGYLEMKNKLLDEAERTVLPPEPPTGDNLLVPKRDQFGAPVWPADLKLLHGRHPLAGEYGKYCYRTACQRAPAKWYNRGSLHYYCGACAIELNAWNHDVQYKDGLPMCIREETEERKSGYD